MQKNCFFQLYFILIFEYKCIERKPPDGKIATPPVEVTFIRTVVKSLSV